MFKAYLQLFRIPNVFSAIADISAGFLLVHATWSFSLEYIALVVSSCLLYLAGLVLNDVYDVDIDRHERPSRPLPSGRISVESARILGYGLLAAGIAVGWTIGLILVDEAKCPYRCGLVVTLLAGCIVGYDRWFKTTFLGPPLMGSCRLLNLLLGASTASHAFSRGPWFLAHYEPAQLVAAGGVGVYIAGVTLYARHEAHPVSRWYLFGASAVVVAGIGILMLFPGLVPSDLCSRYAERISLFYTALAVFIGWRCLRGAVEPTPYNVQSAVIVCLMSLIVLDAAICLVVHEANYALTILALLIPTVVLGRWFSAT